MPKVKVISAGFVAGSFYPAGTVLDLSERQANTGLRRGRVEIITEDGKKTVTTPEGGNPGPVVVSPNASLKVAEIKAKLDGLSITYPANANKDALVALLDEAEKKTASDPLA